MKSSKELNKAKEKVDELELLALEDEVKELESKLEELELKYQTEVEFAKISKKQMENFVCGEETLEEYMARDKTEQEKNLITEMNERLGFCDSKKEYETLRKLKMQIFYNKISVAKISSKLGEM